MKVAKLICASLVLVSLNVRADEQGDDVARTPASESGSATAPAAEGTTSLDDVIQKVLKIVIDKTVAAKGRVAIMDFPSLESGRLTALSAYVANKAGNKMIEAGRQVVDRAALERIISEQKLQQNSLMDAATASKVGRLAGAGVFVVGNYSILKKKFAITVRALSVETGQFVAAAEETVVFNADLRSEVDELNGKAMATSSKPNLDGEASEEGEAAAPANAKNTADFDRKVCALLSKNAPVLKVYKQAFDSEILDLESISSDGVTGINHNDASGEEMGPAFNIGDWWIKVGSWAIDRSTLGAAFKGKIDSYYKIEAWTYEGSTPGLEACAPKIGWWTTERAMSGKPKKKKK